MDWIDICDGLPETAGMNVFVEARNKFGQSSTFLAFQGYGDGAWYTGEVAKMEHPPKNNKVAACWQITHWMPLPKPQKEDYNEQNID